MEGFFAAVGLLLIVVGAFYLHPGFGSIALGILVCVIALQLAQQSKTRRKNAGLADRPKPRNQPEPPADKDATDGRVH